MADRPTASTSRAGRPTCIPIASKAESPGAQSVQKTQVKSKGKGTGKGVKKKLGKAVVVISSDSEVDFPHHPPDQPVNLPAEKPQEPNQPLDIPAEESEEPNQPVNVPAEGEGEP